MSEYNLSSFLRQIASDIDEKKLAEEQVKRVGEFFMSWKFEEINTVSHSDEEFLKFFTLGWYVYTQILKVD